MKNWAGNFQFQAQQIHQPKSIAEVQAVVRAADKAKVFGARHSFNHIADTPTDHISLEHLNQIVSLDPQAQTVTVEGGIRYGDLAIYLHQHGYALHNLASLPHITVAGACATATHGSGEKNGNLATSVRGLEVVTGSGEVVTFTEDTLAGAVVGLGAIGVVTKVTLAIEPTYQMRQWVYCEMPLSQMIEHFDEIQTSAYSVSLFTDWQGDTINQVWLKQRTEDDDPPAQDFYGAVAATENLHPIPAFADEAINCTEQLGIIGPWYERLPHFKLNFLASAGDELQSEYFVPRAQAQSALHAMQTLQHKIAPLLYCSEIRTIAADDLWMSPCYQRDSVAIHFTWKPLWPEVKQVLPQIEKALEPMGARPHWGKLFTMSDLHYEKLDAFRKLISTHDPNRKFANAFLEEYVY
jgi:xylitol oxidase